MTFKLYPDSEKAWTAMYSRMKQAKKSIHIEMYIFTADTQRTHDFIKLLKEKALEGLQIILIFDVFGSLALSNSVVKELREVGVEIRFFRHIFYRTHKKILLIDGRIAFLGGVNITEHARDWKDLQVEVTGRIVAFIYRSFKRTYKLTGGKHTPYKPQSDYSWRGRVQIWMLENMPIIGKKMLKDYYLDKLNSAQKSIVFVTPYFIPSRWMLGAMRNALSRDVEITVLIPSDPDFLIAEHVNKYYAAKVTRMGIKVYYMPGMNHAKAAMIDDAEGLIGSANIDALSFNIDNEIGIFFTDETFVRELKKVIKMWEKDAVLYDYTRSPLKWYTVCMIPFIRLFHPVL